MRPKLRLLILLLLLTWAFRPGYGQLSLTVSSEPVTCYGYADGTITITAEGGTAPYDYWYGGPHGTGEAIDITEASYTFTGVRSGNYFVVVTDALGNEVDDQVRVNTPDPLLTLVSPSPAAMCPDNDLQLNGNPMGGNGGYIHAWSGPGDDFLDRTDVENPVFNSGITGLWELNYKVTDQNGCEADEDLSVEVFSSLTASFSASDVTCFNGNNGSITLSDPDGGSGSYEYMITGSGWQSTAFFGSLFAEIYDVRVRDAGYPDECQAYLGTAVVGEPDELTASVTHDDVTCHGGNNGTITILSPAGGSGAYEYRLNGGTWEGSENFESLSADIYLVEMRDANDHDCIMLLDDSYVVGQPAEMTAALTHEDVTCHGGTDGSISIVSPAGGSGSYEYRIDGGAWQGSVNFESLAAGSYLVEMRDEADSDCIIVLAAGYTVNEPGELTAGYEYEDVTICHGYTNGWIEVKDESGSWAELTGNYEYSANGGSTWQPDPLFENLEAGSYTVHIRDADNPDCFFVVVEDLVLQEPEPITADIEFDAVSCYGGNDGRIKFINVSGGKESYQYSINGGFSHQTNPEFLNLHTGTYNLSVRNNTTPPGHCPVTIDPSFELSQPEELSADVNAVDVSECHGNTNGSITIANMSGGSGDYEYSADGGANWQPENVFADIPAGTYEVYIRDANATDCEMFLQSVVISQPELLEGDFSVNDVSCFGGSDGSIEISGTSGGSGEWEFTAGGVPWQTDPVIGGLAEGDYEVLMRDRVHPGCIVSLGNAIVSQPLQIDLSVLKIVDNECFGNSGGSIEVAATGGTPGYIYRLYDDGTPVGELEPVHPESALFEGLPAGSGYTVEVTDSRGCGPVVSGALVVAEPDELEILSDDIEHIDCYGAETGRILINAAGGSGTIRFSVDGSAFFDNGGLFEDLPAGLYDVSVTDDNGCTTSYGEVEIEQPELMGAGLSHTDVTCFGLDDGTIEITGPFGGTGDNYEYSVDGVNWVAGTLFSGLAPGTYNVLMRDADAAHCIIEPDESPLQISEPAPLVMDVAVVDVDCNGDMSGSVTVMAEGGNGGYEFRLDDGEWQEEALFDNLAAGSYLVQTRDMAGCAANLVVNIDEPPAVGFFNIDSDDETCFGANDGYIDIDMEGGTMPYSYSIDGGESFHDTKSFFNLAPAVYHVLVSDANGCEDSYYPLLVLAASEIVLSSALTEMASCKGLADGSIDVAATGGKGTLEYSLDNETYQSGGFFGGLPAGDYTVYVRDENDCVELFGLTVGEPDELEVVAEVLNTACFDAGSDPAVRAMGLGGNAPYSITLLMDGSVAGSFEGVAEGEWVVFESLEEGRTGYEIVLDDDSGCGPVASEMLSTVIPDELVLVGVAHTDLECYGVNEGTIEVEVSGGTVPYYVTLYNIDDELVDMTEALEDALFGQLPAGTYRVEVTDANGCGPVMSGDIEILQPAEIVVENIFSSGSDCFGDNEGTISIEASGGTGVLEYSVNGGVDYQSSPIFEGLPAGDYGVTVRDSDGCVAGPAVVSVTEPDELVFDLQVNHIIIGSPVETGSVIIGIDGGTAPYQYSIDNGSQWQDENAFEDLPEGDYDIMVIDANGCIAETTVTLLKTTGITATVTLVSPSCHGYSDGMITIDADLGTEPYEYSIDNGASFVSTATFDALTAGSYVVVVVDAVGYTYQETVELTQPDPVEAGAVIVDAWCNNASPDGSVTLTVSGGTGGYSYIWSDGSEESDITGIDPGEYSVEITDENGCEAMYTFTVGYEHLVSVSSDELIICPGESLQLEPVVTQSGMSAVYSWSASDGAAPGPIASPLVSPGSPTLYTLRVTDENNCYDEGEIFVDLHPLLGISAGNDTVVLQGTLFELEATGGEFAAWSWAPSTGLSATDGPVTMATVTADIRYYVYGETAEGCIEHDSVMIRVLLPVEPVSGFTPNDDGINDFFDIVNSTDYPEIVVEVFNRAGQRVFHSRGYSDDKRWDGTFNGRELPMGTYYYVITLNDVYGSRPITGPVTIVR